MNDEIIFTPKTQKIVKKLESLSSASHIDFSIFHQSSIPREVLLNWMQKQYIVDKKAQYLLESLYVSLFKNLCQKIDMPRKKADWLDKLKFLLLAIAGTVLFASEGFDGITSILGLMSLSPMVVFSGGLCFALLSVIVFYTFDLVDISNALGVRLKNTRGMVDVCLQQIEMIKELRRKINPVHDSLEELKKDRDMLIMLQCRFTALDEARNSLKEALENPALKNAKILTAGVTGVFFFSSGFFVGQTIGLAIAGLFMTTATVGFWPVTLLATAAGLASLRFYWYRDRFEMENLIGRWVGLDEEKINALCSDEDVQADRRKFKLLEAKLEKQHQILTANLTLSQQCETLTQTIKQERKRFVENETVKQRGAPVNRRFSTGSIFTAQLPKVLSVDNEILGENTLTY